MSGFIGNTLNTCPPNDKDKNILHLLFGDKTCQSDPLTKFFWFFGLAILATILYLVLTCQFIQCFIKSYINNPVLCSAITVVLFFIGILLIDFLITSWRRKTHLCSQTPCGC